MKRLRNGYPPRNSSTGTLAAIGQPLRYPTQNPPVAATKAAAHTTSVATRNAGVTRPLGSARRAVRGLSASDSASNNRLATIAKVRAVTMQSTISSICPTRRPVAVRVPASTIASTAQGKAKMLWCSLMSAATAASWSRRRKATGVVVMKSEPRKGDPKS